MTPRPMLAWMFVVFCLPVCATDFTVYKGLIGKAAVVMELASPSEEGMLSGRYFYARQGVDIPLSGTLAHLEEPMPLPQPDEPVAGAVWSGSLRNGVYEGHWRKAGSAKKLRFRLTKVGVYDPEALRPGAVQAVTEALTPGVGSGIAFGAEVTSVSSPYLFLKLAEPMKPGKTEGGGAVVLQWMEERRTKIRYPRLIKHPDAGVKARVNRLLESRHFALVLSALECASTQYEAESSSAAGGYGGFDEEQITVSFLSATLMSVVESGSTFCGGAHPDNHFEPYTLDLVKGAYLDFSRLFRGVEPKEAGGPAEENDPPEDQGWEHELLALADRIQPPGKDDDLDCREQLRPYLAVYFSSGPRLQLAVSGIGHALGCCLGDQLELGLEDVAPLLTEEGKRYLGLE